MRSYTRSQFSKNFEFSDLGLCIIDPDTNRIDYCNRSFTQLLNKAENDVIDQDYIDLLGEQWKITSTLFSELQLHSSVLKRNLVTASVASELDLRPLAVTYVAVHSEQEDCSWLILSVELIDKDIELLDSMKSATEVNPVIELARSNILLSEANMRLKESRKNLESAFEAGNLGHCGINFITGEVTLSKRGRNFFGLSPDIEISWEILLEAVNAEYHGMVNAAFSDALTLGKDVDSTYSITHFITKETRWLRVMAKVHFNAAGEPLKLFGLVMDITEQKNDEQRKNDFIAMVSHELKTPITSAQGYVQLIQRKVQENGNTLVGSLASKAFAQLGRMSKLIHGFLNVSRLESGKIDMHPERFNFKQLIMEVIEDANATIPSHSFHADEYVDIEVYADRDKIQQVLNNLISNAVKYSAAGSNVNIIYERKGSFLHTRVKDEGIGMEAETLPLVFDRFYRVESKPTENISGFGIGLYICKEIVERHQGRIWADSKIGNGTIFSFTLPIE